MAVITANTGSNNWNTNGAWVGSVQPGAGDDVIIPATAVVTIPTGVTALARSVTVSASGTVAFATTSSVLTIGDGTAGAGSVALSVSATATITLTGIGIINFASTSGTQQTIATGGKTMPTTNITGAGSSYLLSDDYTSSGNITHDAGTFDTGNQAVSCVVFNHGNGTTRTITMGSSTITVSSTGTGWNTTSTTGLTVTTNTATISFTSASTATGASQALNWQGLSLSFASTVTTASVTGTGTLKNLTYAGGSIKTSVITLTSTPTVTGTLTLTGQSAVNRILLSTGTIGTNRTITTAAFALTNVDIMDITAAGAGGTWTGTSLGNCLGNSNITFDTPATQTHTASAGGSWSDVSKWTSRVPLPQDDVVVDSNTTGTLTPDMPRLGANIDFTGFAGTADFSSTANTVYGSLTLASGMTVSGTQTLTLAARSSKTITSATKTFTQAVTITNPSGTYTLADAFNTAGVLTFGNGTFTTADFTINCSTFVTTTGTINLGASTVNLNSTANTTVFSVSGTATINAGTSNIVIATTSSLSRTILCQGRTLATVTYTVAGSTGSLAFNVAISTIGTLNFSDASNARTIIFQSGFTTTFTGTFNVNGTAGKLMSITSSSAGSAATISKAAGVVSCDYLSVKDSTALGGANWYAGANSTNVSGNTGWIFAIPSPGNFFRLF
jgi:hypothetical protein